MRLSQQRANMARVDAFRDYASWAIFWRDAAGMAARLGRDAAASFCRARARRYARLARLSCGGAR